MGLSNLGYIEDNKNIKWKYFYMLLMILWSAKTTNLLKIGPENPILSIIYLLIIFYTYKKFCRNSSRKPLKIIFSIFSVWYIAICLKYNQIQPIYWGILINSFIVYVAFSLYKNKEFFIYVDKVLTHLSVISLIVWFAYTILPNLITEIMDLLSVGENAGTMRANFFVVGIGKQPAIDGLSIKRNIGFTWEGGRFACYLIFAIFINLTLKNFSISYKNNKSLYIYLLALISTFSTTGIVSLLPIIIYYAYNKSNAYRIATIIACWLIIPTVWGLSFIGEKIIHLTDYETEIENIRWIFSQGRVQDIVPQRITGIYLEIQNLIHDFWLGYNINENSYSTKFIFGGERVWAANGIIQILSMYGIFIGLFFYYLLFKSSILITEHFEKKGNYLFALIFMTINVSYEFWTSCICLYCVYFYLFSKYSSHKRKNRITYEYSIHNNNSLL